MEPGARKTVTITFAPAASVFSNAKLGAGLGPGQWAELLATVRRTPPIFGGRGRGLP